MIRFIASLLFAAVPAAAQDAPTAVAAEPPSQAESLTLSADELVMPEEDAEAPADPVTAWEEDRNAILPAEGIDLGAFEYVARPLVIFADSPLQPQVEEQIRLLEADLGALADRDVVIIIDTDPEARSEVRRDLRPRGFGLVLVDKDGRVTLRRPAPLSVREIARAIDRTPLRQEETRYRSSD